MAFQQVVNDVANTFVEKLKNSKKVSLLHIKSQLLEALKEHQKQFAALKNSDLEEQLLTMSLPSLDSCSEYEYLRSKLLNVESFLLELHQNKQ